MKATILISVFASLIFSVNINAKNVKTYVNIEDRKSSLEKEYISLDKETLKPILKEYYLYDYAGNIQEKIVSKWSDRGGWINYFKYAYSYLENGKVANVTFTEWNTPKNTWSDKSDFLIHLYDDNSEFLSVKKIEIDNNIDDFNLVSQK